jgi:hypothetical protein
MGTGWVGRRVSGSSSSIAKMGLVLGTVVLVAVLVVVLLFSGSNSGSNSVRVGLS